MIAAAIMGGFYATPQDRLSQDESPRGIMYTETYKRGCISHVAVSAAFHGAVSAALADELPTLPQLVRAIALAPGSCSIFTCANASCASFLKDCEPRIQQRTCVLAKQGDRATAAKEYKELYINPRSFLLRLVASERAVCPVWCGRVSSGVRPVGCIS